MEKLLLIDGNSIMNRAFYGVPDLTNAAGLHTNAVYGFLNIIFRFIDEEKPDYLAIAFDLHAPTFRHKMYDAYKGTRKGMPDELREQVPYIKRLVSCMNIKTVELEGYEADDLLGTLAKRGMASGMDVSLLSGDRDLLQIADEKIKIRIPKTIRGVTTVEDYYPEDVKAKYNVTPIEFIHQKALMGDSSDNIPGVPKVGEKTANELIVSYHSLDGIYEHIDEISKPSIKQSLIENKDLAYLCLKLATIEINAPINVLFDELKYNLKFTNEGYDVVKELNLKSYFKKFEDNLSEDISVEPKKEIEFITVNDKEGFDSFKDKADKSAYISYSFDSFGSSVTLEDSCFYIPCVYDIQSLIKEYVLQKKSTVITEETSSVYALFDESDFSCKSSDITDFLFSVKIASYLINPTVGDYSLANLSSSYIGLNIYTEDNSPKGMCEKSHALMELYKVLKDELIKTEQFDLFKNVEMPLSLVLYEMERRGILVKKDALKEYELNLSDSINALEKSIYEEAGEEFNILSPKQLGTILFEKMQMPYSKKTKTGYSTSADVLEKLASEYPFVNKILEYRGLTKLKSTYAVGLNEAISDDGRIHSHFLQCVTATGRISSADPNLQNIPIRTELGRELRKVFIPKEGFFFADADYSQIELRVLAHVSKDKKLIDAFNSGKDIHSVTASSVFNIPVEEVTSMQRRVAKVVNFGIIYGMSSFSLGQDLDITRKEAEKYISEYFDKYPAIKTYLDGCVESAKNLGYSITEYKRRRPINELKSSQFMQREFGKRVAMNAPIQGTAADIMKIAMINVRDSLCKNNLKSGILIQVHDELLLEVANDEKDIATGILKEEMEKAVKMAVPLTVELNVGENWYETK